MSLLTIPIPSIFPFIIGSLLLGFFNTFPVGELDDLRQLPTSSVGSPLTHHLLGLYQRVLLEYKASKDKTLTARVFAVDSHKPPLVLNEYYNDGAVALNSDGRRIVATLGNGQARIWDSESGLVVSKPIDVGGPVSSLVFRPDGSRIVSVTDDNSYQAKVWDTHSGNMIYPINGHADKIQSVSFSQDGRRIITASDDRTARVWDADKGRLHAELRGHKAGINTAEFSAKRSRIVTASDDGTARLWNADTGKLLAVLNGHQKRVLSARFSPDSRYIVTASEDGTVRVWDATPETRSYEELAKLIRCHVPAQFERPDSSSITFRMPTPQECEAMGAHPAASQPTPK